MLDKLFGLIDEDKLPLKHQIGRAIVAGFGALVAETLITKAYDSRVKPKKRRK